MGTILHHAIIVTGWGEHIEIAHAKARGVMPNVSELIPSSLNGFKSFLVPPDGSKAGWVESDAGDKSRESFRVWLAARAYDDGSSALDWVEVEYSQDLNTYRVSASPRRPSS